MTDEMKTTEQRIDDIEEMRKSQRLYVLPFNVAMPGWLLARVLTEILPDDVRVVGSDRDISTNCNYLCVWSEKFPEGKIAERIKELTINVTVGPDKEIERVFLTEYNYETKQSEERTWQ